MDLLIPAYRITLAASAGGAGSVIDTTSEPRGSTLVSLVTRADMTAAAGSATLVLGHAAGIAPAVGDAVTIDLGYLGGDSLVTVLTGTVVQVAHGLGSTVAEVEDAGYALARLPGNGRTYEQPTAGTLARELASLADVTTGAVDDGTSFPAYVIDGRRSAARHLRDLAALCGFDTYLDPSNRLVFHRWAAAGATTHIYDYGKHLLELDMRQADPAAGAVTAWGESPGLGRGSTAWAWLTKDFSGSTGSAGHGSPAALLEMPVLRTADAAQTAAAAYAAEAARDALTGWLRGLGRAELALGDAVALRGLPDPALNGTYQVRGVEHRLGKAAGFTTTVSFRSQATGGA
jgi:hypothetical protein